MSDHDRGAYTPQHDEPLSFDARQSRGRRAFPATLLISLVILIGLGVAIFMFYRSGVRGAGEAPVPVGSPVGEIKTPASGPSSAPADTAQGLQIYKAEGGAPAAPSSAPTNFAPLPEQPSPRPAPTAPVAAQPLAPAAQAPAPRPAPPAAVTDPTASGPAKLAAPASKSVAVDAAPVKPVPKTETAKPAPSAKASPKDEIGALLDSKPVKQADTSAKADVAKKAAAAAPAPSATAHGAALVQFGAFSSTELAGSEWAKLAKAYPSQMAGKGKAVESVERNGKTLFRGAVSGFASKADAVAFCTQLKADGKACIVK